MRETNSVRVDTIKLSSNAVLFDSGEETPIVVLLTRMDASAALAEFGLCEKVIMLKRRE